MQTATFLRVIKLESFTEYGIDHFKGFNGYKGPTEQQVLENVTFKVEFDSEEEASEALEPVTKYILYLVANG